jgi:formylglycine-generating enzyme required for sulfatase activity
MNIFISYARVDKHFCTPLVTQIQKMHKVWYDGRLEAGQDWKQEIYRRLLWCNVFIYLLSPDSVKSIPCQRELRVMQKLKRPVIPVVISKDTKIPTSLSHLHYIDMSHGMTPENITELLAVLMKLDRKRSLSGDQQDDEPEIDPVPEFRMEDVPKTIHNVQRALNKEEYENASVFLSEIPTSFLSNIDELETLIKITNKAVEDRARLKEAKREFNMSLSRYKTTRDYLLDSFEVFSQHILGDGDTPEDIPPTPSTITFPKEDFVPQVSEHALLPMLQWCHIPWGIVHVSSIANDDAFGEQTVRVDNFVIGKYPVTNAQFDVFFNVEDGYHNPRWWQFSEQAKNWFDSQATPLRSKFSGDELPRENVCWYEAMAFCNWLSNLLNMDITLPTVAQWQRAAQGDDDRIYPWGDEYHKDHCNTLESELNKTTPVNKYVKGESVYGVYDMSGNVWEWALDRVAPNEENPTYRHAVIGGSFVSPCDRAQIPFRYYLESRTHFSSIGFRVVGLT